jgi:hypothetical protein
MSENEPPPGWPQQQPGYGYQPPTQPPAQPGYPPYAPYAYPAPPHPEATKVLVLGLVALVGGMACYLPLFVAPFAWVIGNRVNREINAAGGQWGGRSETQTGRILGMVGTGLLVLGLLVLTLFISLGVAGVFDESGNSNV